MPKSAHRDHGVGSTIVLIATLAIYGLVPELAAGRASNDPGTLTANETPVGTPALLAPEDEVRPDGAAFAPVAWLAASGPSSGPDAARARLARSSDGIGAPVSGPSRSYRAPPVVAS